MCWHVMLLQHEHGIYRKQIDGILSTEWLKSLGISIEVPIAEMKEPIADSDKQAEGKQTEGMQPWMDLWKLSATRVYM